MHYTALDNCQEFIEKYDIKDYKVLDVGSYDVNGTVKPLFIAQNCEYTGLDIEKGKNVDVVMKLGEKLPFKDNSFDVIVSTSCLEHDPAFWETVREMMRVSRGYIYLNAPSAQNYHAYPIDCWRFLADSMKALSRLSDEWELLESYVDHRLPWGDCVGIFKCTS